MPLLDVLEVCLRVPNSILQCGAKPKRLVSATYQQRNFHRDTPFEDFTEAQYNRRYFGLDDMAGENGERSSFARVIKFRNRSAEGNLARSRKRQLPPGKSYGTLVRLAQHFFFRHQNSARCRTTARLLRAGQFKPNGSVKSLADFARALRFPSYKAPKQASDFANNSKWRFRLIPQVIILHKASFKI